MNKEQFFKAIDNVDDELLKGVFEDLGEALPDAESKHGAVYRPERRSGRKTFIAAAACLAAVVGTGFALKTAADTLFMRSTNHIESPMDNSDNTSDTTSDLKGHISEDGIPQSEWSLGMGCMTYVSFLGNDDPSPFAPTYLEITKPQTVTASLKSNFHPDLKMPQDNIPYRIFVFADGKPVEFAPEGTDDYALWHDYSMDENDITDHKAASTVLNDGTTIYLPRYEDTVKIDFKADENTHIINFVYCFFPELCQPKSWLSFNGTYTSMAVNTAYVPGAPAEIKQVGEYITPDDPHGRTGRCDYLYSADEPRNAYIWKDLEYSEQNNSIYIEYNSGKRIATWVDTDSSGNRTETLINTDTSGSFYLFLLIDGELVPAFDGDYTCFVDCKDGSRTFKYQIPPELLPESGRHTVIFKPIPAEDCGEINDIDGIRATIIAID